MELIRVLKKISRKMHSIALDCIIFDKILDPPHVAHSSKIGAYMSLLEAEFQKLVCLKRYPDNWPPVRVGVSVKVRVCFRVGGQPDNCPGEKLPPG